MLNLTTKLKPNIPTILLLPGSLTSPYVYSKVKCDLAFQMATVDYCKSDGPWDVTSLGERIIELIDYYNLGPTILVGYSAGGVISMAAAANSPDKVAGMLLSNTGPSGKGHGDPNFPQKILDNWGDKEFFHGFFKRCFSGDIPTDVLKELEEYIGGIDKNAAYAISYSLRNVDYREDLKKVKCPVVVAHGNLDTSRTTEHVEMIKNAMAQTEVYYLDGGHTIMVENLPQWQDKLNKLVEQVKKIYNI